MGRARGWIALALIVASACERQSDRVGAASADEQRSPQAGPGHETLVPGCCSFSSAGLNLERLPSDSYILQAKRDALDLSIAFGPFESVTPPPGATMRSIDGITLFGSTGGTGGALEKLWVAPVPASAKGQAAGGRPYGLRITARCDTPAACRPADDLVASLRF